MEPLITLKEVAVRYKRSGNLFRRPSYYEALSCINLDIYPGETLGILGNNGAGKSTLLRIISGVLKPNKGKVINRGASVSLLALQASFDQNLNGRENAILSGMFQGIPKKIILQHLDEIQQYANIGDFFDEPIRTYSTGMLARLGFSIATITKPDVLLIDEVLGVGDKEFREKAERTLIQRVQSAQSVVLVTHSHQRAEQLCDRIAYIHDGKLSFDRKDLDRRDHNNP